jgi:folate-binding protein YgfZ
LIVSNPLVLHHEKLGAQLDVDQTPLNYGDPTQEYWAVKKGAGLTDISYTGRLSIAGKDRLSFLNSLLTNDASQLKDGMGQHSALLNTKARVHADLYLYNQPNRVIVDTGDSLASRVKENLERYVITEDVQIQDVGGNLVLITLQGANATKAVRETLGVDAEGLKPLHSASVGPSTIISRDRTGLGGFDIFLPANEAEAVWQGLLLRSGEFDLSPVGTTALEALRLEAGFPKYGVDVDENTIVLEAGYKDAISFTKGCYLGQEVVARATHIGRVNKQLARFDLETQEPPLRGTRLKSNGSDAGFITSAAFSPGLGKVVSLGYANREFAKLGTKLEAEYTDKTIPAAVTKIL